MVCAAFTLLFGCGTAGSGSMMAPLVGPRLSWEMTASATPSATSNDEAGAANSDQQNDNSSTSTGTNDSNTDPSGDGNGMNAAEGVSPACAADAMPGGVGVNTQAEAMCLRICCNRSGWRIQDPMGVVPSTLTAVRGWVSDENGQGLAGAKASVCVKDESGMTQCLPPVDTQSDGTFLVDLTANSCVSDAAFRVILPGQNRTAMYCMMPMDKRDGTQLTLLNPMKLYATVPPTSIPAMGSGEEPVTVQFDGGFEMTVIPWDLTSSYNDLQSTSIPGDTPGFCFLEGQQPPVRLHGFSPDGDYQNGRRLQDSQSRWSRRGLYGRHSCLGRLNCKD